jgi:hypothetical protein
VEWLRFYISIQRPHLTHTTHFSITLPSANARKIMDALCNKVDAFKLLDVFKNKFEVPKTLITLTTEEIRARKEWNEARKSFIKDNESSLYTYNGEIPHTFDSIQRFLSFVIVPPLFTVSDASARSKYDEIRKHGYYCPLEIKPWTAFTSIVEKEIAQLDAMR